MNTVVREHAGENLGENERIHLIEPLDAIDFHSFASRAHLIMSDSGSVRGEAPSLGIIVLVLLDTIERPKEGGGKLKFAGTNKRPF